MVCFNDYNHIVKADMSSNSKKHVEFIASVLKDQHFITHILENESHEKSVKHYSRIGSKRKVPRNLISIW